MRRLGWSVLPSAAVPALLLHLASWFAMLAHGHDWIGGWMGAVDNVAGSVVIAGPVLAGLTANLYAHRLQTALPVLGVSSVRPMRAWYAPALRFWALAAANLALLVVEAGALVGAAGARVSPRPLVVIPVCVLVLGGHVLVGMVIGLRLPPRLAGAIAGSVSFGLFLLAVAHLAPRSFVIGGATGGLVGERYRILAIFVLSLVAALTVVALAMLSGWNWRWLRTRVAVSAAALLAVFVLSNSSPKFDDRYEAVAATLRCAGAEPVVCLPADTPRALSSGARRMRRLSEPLRAAGVDLPERWVDYWGQRPDPRVGMLGLRAGAELKTRLPDEDLLRSLATPATCPDYFGPMADQRSLDVRWLLASWIALRNGQELFDPGAPKAWFSSKESEAWVRSTYAKLRSCDLDALRFPSVKR